MSCLAASRGDVVSLADDLRNEARCVHPAAADAMRFAADELDRGTAERDALLVVRDAMQSQLDAWFVAHPHPPADIAALAADLARVTAERDALVKERDLAETFILRGIPLEMYLHDLDVLRITGGLVS